MSFQNCRIVNVGAEPEAYFKEDAPRGDAAHTMSSSGIRAFWDCPAEWVAGVVEDDTRSTIFGTLLDCVVLTHGQFGDRYVVTPESYPAGKRHKRVINGEIEQGAPLPWKANAGWCEKWLKEHLPHPKTGMMREPVGHGLMLAIEAAAKRIRVDEMLHGFIEASDHQLWLAGEWVDEGTSLVVPVKCLIDLAPRPETEWADSLGDLKTTRDAAIVPYQRASWKLGYHIQARWNLELFNAAMAEERPRKKFCHVVVKNTPPFQTARRVMSGDVMDAAWVKIKRVMATYCSCLQRQKWPDYDQTDESNRGWSVIEMEPWMEMNDTFAPRFELDPEAQAAAEEANDPAWMKGPVSEGQEEVEAEEEV